MAQVSFYLIIALISLIFIAATILLGRKRIHKAFLKYIPAITAAVIALTLYIKAVRFSNGFEGLGYAILAMIAIIVFLASIITAVIVELINRKGRRQ